MIDDLLERIEEIDHLKLKVALISVLLIGVFSATAYASYTIIYTYFKPCFISIEFADLPITIEKLELRFNETLLAYDYVEIQIRNDHSVQLNLNVSLIFYNDANTVIASYEQNIVIDAGASEKAEFNINVSVEEVASAKIVIYQNTT